MRKTIEVITCDICKKQIEEKKPLRLKIPVIFHTDQTEGRWSEPYISMEEMDLCQECTMKITNVHGRGAQGFNEYELRIQKEEK